MAFNLISRLPSHDAKERPKVKLGISDDIATVGHVRERALKLSDGLASKDEVQLLLSGRILRDDAVTLESLNLKSYSCIYAVKRPQPVAPPTAMEAKNLSDAEIDQFFIAFGIAMRNPNLNAIIKRLNERENLASMAAACPGLAQDSVGMALLSKPEMLQQLMKPKLVKKLAKEHPALHEAMVNLAASVHEEKQAGASANDADAAAAINPFTYHLDDMSDVEEDEEMDDNQFQGQNLQRNPSFSAITPNQLAAAIAAAQNNTGSAAAEASDMGGVFGGMYNVGGTPSSSSASSAPSTSRPTPSSPLITQDMFRNAMEQALAVAAGANPLDFPPPSGAPPTAANAPAPMEIAAPPQEPDYTEQINRMKEMGIVDEGLARKALKVMGGDLQNAVDLIFSGWVGEDD